MATLKYSDKHNMVAFLKKPNESVGFTKIVDFLKGTSLRGYAGEHVPLLPAMLADEATTIGVGVETEGATTTTSGLDAGLDSGNIHESPLRSHEAPLHEGHTSGSNEDSLQLKELMKGDVPLEGMLLRKKDKEVVVLTHRRRSNRESGRKIQDIDDYPLVSLVREFMEEKAADLITPTKISASGEVQEEDISPTTLEAAKTLSQVVSQRARSTNKGKRYKRKTRTIDKDISTGVNTGSTPVSTPSIVQKVNVIISSLVKGQRERKTPMFTEDVQDTKRTKEHIRQEEADLAEAMRLQALQDEEAARQSEEDWDNIRAKLEVNTELVKDVLGENVTSIELQKESSKKQNTIGIEEESAAEPVVAKEEEIEEQIKKRGKRKKQKARKGIHADKTAQHEVEEDMEALIKGNDTDSSSGTDILISAVPIAIKPPTMLKSISRDDLTELYRLVMQRYGTNRPEDEYERVFWGDIKTMFDPPLIYMLTDRRYPLPADVCQAMLSKKLQVDKKDEACYQFCNGVEKDCLSVNLATTQQMVISSPCLTDIKNWLALIFTQCIIFGGYNGKPKRENGTSSYGSSSYGTSSYTQSSTRSYGAAETNTNWSNPPGSGGYESKASMYSASDVPATVPQQSLGYHSACATIGQEFDAWLKEAVIDGRYQDVNDYKEKALHGTLVYPWPDQDLNDYSH
ncbi:hypothetical protein Tco_0090339, partial [Tanacetum coccineum]